MKIFFHLVIEGQESLEDKLKKSFEENADLSNQIMMSFANAIVLALGLNSKDPLAIVNFNVGKVPDPVPISQAPTLVEKNVAS